MKAKKYYFIFFMFFNQSKYLATFKEKKSIHFTRQNNDTTLIEVSLFSDTKIR